MARGFESKDVEFQQAEADRAKALKRGLTADERASSDERRSLELALARLRADRAAATHPTHQAMLDRAIEAVEARRAGP